MPCAPEPDFDPIPEVEDPGLTLRRNVWALEKLLGMLHHPLCSATFADGRPSDDAIVAYDAMVVDVCQAVSRVAATIGF